MGRIDDPAAQGVGRRKRDRVNNIVEPSPLLCDALEDGFHLSRNAHVERHQDRRLELASERLDIFPGLVIEIRNRDLGAQRAKSLGAAPRDRLLVGNADDESLLAFQQLGFNGRNHPGILSCRGACRAESSSRVWRAIINSSSVGMT